MALRRLSAPGNEPTPAAKIGTDVSACAEVLLFLSGFINLFWFESVFNPAR